MSLLGLEEIPTVRQERNVSVLSPFLMGVAFVALRMGSRREKPQSFWRGLYNPMEKCAEQKQCGLGASSQARLCLPLRFMIVTAQLGVGL